MYLIMSLKELGSHDSCDKDVQTVNSGNLDKEFKELEKSDFLLHQNLKDYEDDNYNNYFCRWDGCGTRFKDLDSMAQHIWKNHVSGATRAHASSVGYECRWEDCPRHGAPVHSRHALITHIRTHTGEVPYYCIVPECRKIFTRPEAIPRHLHTVHGVKNTQTIWQAKDELRNSIEGKTLYLSRGRDFKVNATINTDQILATLKKRLQRETENGVEGYEQLIKEYCRSSTKGTIENYFAGPIANFYNIDNVSFNPATKDNIFKETQLALSNYNLRKRALETGGATKAMNKKAKVCADDIIVEQNDGLDKSKDLKESLNVMESYSRQLKELNDILDDELYRTTCLKRYWWSKKEALLEAILRLEGLKKEETNTSGKQNLNKEDDKKENPRPVVKQEN